MGVRNGRAGRDADPDAGRPDELTGTDIAVPADLSSAAFLILAATIADGLRKFVGFRASESTRPGPGRYRYPEGNGCRHRTLENVSPPRRRAGCRSDGRAHRRLTGIDVDPGQGVSGHRRVPGAVRRGGLCRPARRRLPGIGELRVKESDRIAAMAEGLACAERDRSTSRRTGAVVHGGQDLRRQRVDSHGDHRIAMAFAVAASCRRGMGPSRFRRTERRHVVPGIRPTA